MVRPVDAKCLINTRRRVQLPYPALGTLEAMVLNYTIHTPMMHDARTQAVNRAKAEGWTRITVTAVDKVGQSDYLVRLVVTK